MAMDFTVKEARQLIERHKKLLSNLEYIASRAANLQADVRRSANAFITQNALKRLVINTCMQQAHDIQRSSEIEWLICSLYKYRSIRSAVETAKSFQSHGADSVRQNITLLKPGLAGLSWFLGGKRAKENAAQAYRELTNILSESYGQMIPHLVSDVAAADDISADIAWDVWRADPRSFMSVMETICPDVVHDAGDNPFQLQLTQLAALEEIISTCHAATDKEKDQIKAAAEKTMAFNALQMLQSIPVEEVNRERVGLRVKTLRDAGITTVADIYSSSSYQLSSIPGISESAAFSMKRIANDMLEEAQKEVKIKLSADDRNKQATELVKAIYV